MTAIKTLRQSHQKHLSYLCFTVGIILIAFLKSPAQSREAGWNFRQEEQSLHTLFDAAKNYLDSGAYEQALYSYARALPLCNGNSPLEALQRSSIYSQMATTFMYLGNYKNAISYYYAALRECEKTGDTNPDILINNFLNLAGTFSYLLDHDRALHYLQKAEALMIQTGNKEPLPILYGNMGSVYGNLGQTDSSEYYFRRALQSYRDAETKVKSADIEAGLLVNLAELHHRKSEHRIARKYLEEALPIIWSRNTKFRANLLSANISMQLKDYAAAEKTLLSELALASDGESMEELMEVHKTLSNLYAEKGDYRLAHQYLVKVSPLEDSIRGISQTEATKKLETQYRTAQKDKEIAEKTLAVSQRDQRIQRQNIMITAITSGIVLLGLLLISSIRGFRQRQKLQAQQLIAMQHARKVEQLQAKIQGEEVERERIAAVLHDGVGSMISASRMNLSTLPVDEAHRDTHQRIVLLLNDAAVEIRNTAHNLMPSLLLQEGLSQAIASFCERIQNGKTLLIDYQFMGQETTLSTELELFVYRLAQELINNTLKHAGASEIMVQLSIRQDLLTISVEDNGKGMDTGKMPKGTGLRNLREKTEIMGGHLTVESAPGNGTQIYAEFDLTLNRSSDISR